MVCRLCLNNDEDQLYSVFDNKENLPEIIKQHISIEIMVTDQLPTTVCIECITKIKDWHKFREQCLIVNDILYKEQNKIPIDLEVKQEPLQIDDDEPANLNIVPTIKSDIPSTNYYSCTVCSAGFTECSEFLDHQRTHDGEPVFQCDKCTEVFSSKEKLVEHDTTHNTPVKMPCPECGKVILKSSLKNHLNKHTDKYMEDDSSSDDSSVELISVETTSLKLPERSQKRYQLTYEQFMNWRKTKNIQSSFSENVLMAYFKEISKRLKPGSLKVRFAMLRSTIEVHHNVNISSYPKLKALLKEFTNGCKPNKPRIFTLEQINQFLRQAPDNEYLFTKVVLVMGISGACRKKELVPLTLDDIADLGTAVKITVIDIETKKERSFTMKGEFYKIYKKFVTLRPPNIEERRFFLNYHNGTCTKYPVGINKFGSIPKQVAAFLHLKNPEMYTIHCIRRSSIALKLYAGEDSPIILSDAE